MSEILEVGSEEVVPVEEAPVEVPTAEVVEESTIEVADEAAV